MEATQNTTFLIVLPEYKIVLPEYKIVSPEYNIGEYSFQIQMPILLKRH